MNNRKKAVQLHFMKLNERVAFGFVMIVVVVVCRSFARMHPISDHTLYAVCVVLPYVFMYVLCYCSML